MIDLSTISNTPIQVEEYEEPKMFQVPQPGVYDNCVILGITKLDQYTNKDGEKHLKITCDIANEHGITLARNQQFNTHYRSGTPFGDTTPGSDILDLCHSAGVTDGITDHVSLAEAIRDIHADQKKFKVRTTWKGFSVKAFAQSIKESTGTDISEKENLFDSAEEVADEDQLKEARKSAKYYVSSFKKNGNEVRESTCKCTLTGATVSAKSIVQIFVVK